MNWDNCLFIHIDNMSYFDRVVLVSKLIRVLNKSKQQYAKKFWYFNLRKDILLSFFNGPDLKIK